MKSLIEEASSIAKAIEKAWDRAGKPQSFSIKIFEESTSNFLGFTKTPAKIGIFFEEQVRQERDVQKRAPRPAHDRQNKPHHATSAQATTPHKSPVRETHRKEEPVREERNDERRNEQRPQQNTHDDRRGDRRDDRPGNRNVPRNKFAQSKPQRGPRNYGENNQQEPINREETSHQQKEHVVSPQREERLIRTESTPSEIPQRPAAAPVAQAPAQTARRVLKSSGRCYTGNKKTECIAPEEKPQN